MPGPASITVEIAMTPEVRAAFDTMAARLAALEAAAPTIAGAEIAVLQTARPIGGAGLPLVSVACGAAAAALASSRRLSRRALLGVDAIRRRFGASP